MNVSLSANEVKLLVGEASNEKEIIIGSECFLISNDKTIEEIFPGDILRIKTSNNIISIQSGNKIYNEDNFEIISLNINRYIICDQLTLRGKLKILNNSGSIELINTLDLESYLKGVIPREMPLGQGKQNYEALKAFAICVRTYALQKMHSKKYFDLYIDVRDQVYGGVEVEQPISNSAVDETKDLILTFNGSPAKVFYHSTCAGKTEYAQNIFPNSSEPYLKTVDDGTEPYCKISHSFNWEEVYSSSLFIERLKNADLINNEFDIINEINIDSRFESGRVNELRINISNSQTKENQSVILKGNNIRSVIRTADNKSILRSIWFDIKLDDQNNVIITGKGYGHGVGLCQYGAIGQSRAGKNYKEILNHYFPGTKISYLNDPN